MTNSIEKVFAAERYAGYKSCLEAAGLSEPACGAAKRLLTPADIAAYVEAHRDRLCRAYVASDSAIAFHFMRELTKRGVRIPDDVQVAAFDDSVLASVSEPAMTVVKIDVVSLGMAAARMLIQQLRAGEQSPEHLLLPVSIIERGSTKMRE